MIVVDTSALMAIILDEPDGGVFLDRILGAPVALISAVNWVEARVVATSNRAPVIRESLDTLIADGRIETAPVRIQQAQTAWDAYRRFGKGRHPARLNLADCFAYALAIDMNAPLLFKGEDFALTGIRSALQ